MYSILSQYKLCQLELLFAHERFDSVLIAIIYTADFIQAVERDATEDRRAQQVCQ